MLNGLSKAYCKTDKYDLAFQTLTEALQNLGEGSKLNKKQIQLSIVECLKKSVALYDQLEILPEMVS